MPRRAEIQVRELDPDPVYSSKLVTQVINKVMLKGKKSTAEHDRLHGARARSARSPAGRRRRCSSRL